MKSVPRLDYATLTSAYWKNLTTQLRGFNPGSAHEFLQRWVHEEDDCESILNMVECAQEAGEEGVVIDLGAETLQKLDLARLTAMAAKLGRVKTQAHEKGTAFEVSFQKGGGAGDPPRLS